jgi:hypothetical protein
MLNKRTGLSASFVALATVAGLAVPAAQAKTDHHYTSVIRSTAINTGAGYPAPGGTAVIAGTWVTGLFGAGAVVDRLTITGQPAPTTFAFKGTEVCYAPKGTIRDVFTGTAVVQPDGSQKITTKGTFTNGTGAYRGAKGSFTYTGATAPGSTIVNGRSAGTITY